jgi:hypothetical protein
MDLEELLLAFTDPQIDQLLVMFQRGMGAVGEAIKTVWLALSPILITYMLTRQAKNRKALTAEIAANSKISEEAFDVANGHNGKIAALTKELLDLKKEKSNVPSRD